MGSVRRIARRLRNLVWRISPGSHCTIWKSRHPHNIPAVIAVTIGVGARYFTLAKQAAESCAAATGLTTFIVTDLALKAYPKLSSSHQLKFHLFDLFPEAHTILYFDADTLFLTPHDFSCFFDVPEFVCVLDAVNKWSMGDSSLVEVPLDSYFNSGFFIASRRHHYQMFNHAASLASVPIPTILKDQGFLNRARLDLGIPLHLLERPFNAVGYDKKTDRNVVLAHLNGQAWRSPERQDLLPSTLSPRARQPISLPDSQHGARVVSKLFESYPKKVQSRSLR